MKTKRYKFLALYLTFFVFALPSVGQNAAQKPDYSAYLRQHIQRLAADTLEGRATGSPAEMKAAAYIAKQYADIGLFPLDNQKNYLQPFDFVSGRKYVGENYVKIGKQKLNADVDYYPLVASGNGVVKGKLLNLGYGIVAPAEAHHDDYARFAQTNGAIGIIQLGYSDPHSPLAELATIDKKVATAVQKGLAAVIFISTDTTESEAPRLDFNIQRAQYAIPVIYVKSKYASALQRAKSVSLAVTTEKVKKTGHNVVGFLPHKDAQTTVVIGAHYDHLGYGESGGSLHAGGKQVHNGADDNASGVAVLIELARYLKQKSIQQNFLFVAFSGEELGLYGSSYFVQNQDMKNSAISYMLNYDMVGRLDTISKKLIVNGVGTSPVWTVLDTVLKQSALPLQLEKTESGIGPSDHTSFYLQQLPVLHFFTGIHTDYHRPSDDAEKINYEGVFYIWDYSAKLIEELANRPKLPFTKTKEEESRKAPAYKVTLGVMPDYQFEGGQGLRIAGVIDGRPAQKAGLQAGDIIVKMGDYTVTDIMTYMEALSKYKKNDSIKIDIRRDNKIISTPITF